MLYCAAFDVSALSAGTITLATAGKTDAVVTLSSVTTTAGDGTSGATVFYHYNNSGSDFAAISEDDQAVRRRGEIAAKSWELSLKNALITAATAQSWTTPSNINVSMSLSTGLVTFSYSATFSITWSTAIGKALCGFSANVSGASSYTGTVVPTYVIKPTLSATSLSTPNFEPNGIATHVVADDGSGYGFARQVAPTYRDWVQQFELKAKAFRANAASTHPWTFQHLFEHCRTEFPFIVSDGFGETFDEIFTLRSDGAQWTQQRRAPGDDVQFHIPFKACVEGALTTQ